MKAESDLSKLTIDRAKAALSSMFVADALSMPVHWFYNPADIERSFPGGIKQFEAAPAFHPSSIMSLHSTSGGGRGPQDSSDARKEIVGDVILKGKRHYWGQPNMHYHQGMKAGENTVNAHCARVLMRTIINADGKYNQKKFLNEYIRFMIADPPEHSDTYVESYHRGFFANREAGKPRDACGAVTHDTPSIGGLVSIAPLAIAALLQQRQPVRVKQLCREHLYLTHPDPTLAAVCDGYVDLIDALLFRDPADDPRQALETVARQTTGLDLSSLVAHARYDRDVVGGRFSTACYITESWPCLLYLAYKYIDDPKTALMVNTNLGGENAYRGSVLGCIVSLACGRTVDDLFSRLADHDLIEYEIAALLKS